MTQFQREEAARVAAVIRSRTKAQKSATLPAQETKAVSQAQPAASDSGLGALVLILFLALFYFMPSIVAITRKHHQQIAICVLNFFLGWTVLGWVVALVWASTAVRPIAAPGVAQV